MNKIVYIYNPSRAHKILPLLEGMKIHCVSKYRDFFKVGTVFDANSIILVDSFGKYAIKALLYSLIYRIPIYVRLRGNFIKELHEVYNMNPSFPARIKMVIHRALGEICIKRSSMVIVNSKYLEEVVRRTYPYKNVEVVYNPYTEKPSDTLNIESKLPSRGKHLLSVTNFNLESKVAPLVNAIVEGIPGDYWEEYDLYWVVCGSGPLSEEFNNKIRNLPFSDRVLFLGIVNGISSLLKWSDIFVHMSKLDAFPNVTLEAMEHGKPVVTNSDSCGTLEQVFHEVNGFVVSSDDEFASAIKNLVENPKFASKFGKAGKKIVENNFSVSKQREKMHQILRASVEVK